MSNRDIASHVGVDEGKVDTSLPDRESFLLKLRGGQSIDRPTFRLGRKPLAAASLEACRCLCVALAGLGEDITPQPPRSLRDALEGVAANVKALAGKMGATAILLR